MISKITVDGVTHDIKDAGARELIDSLEVPTKVSELENDKYYVSSADQSIKFNGRVHIYSGNVDGDGRKVDLLVEHIQGGGYGGYEDDLYINYRNPTDVRILEDGTGTLYYKNKEVATQEYVDEKLLNIDVGDLDLSAKTDTSVMPNDGGEIKTRFRICNKSEDESPVVYFPLVKLPVDNSKNSASAIIRGRIGGYLPQDMAMINALIWNRGTTGISLFNINADTYTLEEPLRICDIVVYTNEDATDTVYLKCKEYFVFDIDLEVYQSTAEIIYDGTYLTEEPSGTLSATASTSDKRVEVYNGKLYLNGTELTGGTGGSSGDYELPIASASTLGGIKVGANLTIDAEGVLSAIGGGEITGEITGEVLPIGTMIPFGSNKNIPSNWRICDGSEVSRTTYADLFNVIGTSYGEGDGETTFNLPDKRGRVSVGYDIEQTQFNEIGKKDGEKKVALTIDEMPSHNHNFIRSRLYFAEEALANALGATSNASTSANATTQNTGGGQAHNNLQPYEVDVWIIKTSNAIGNIEKVDGTIIDNLSSTSSTDGLSANMGRELNNKIENSLKEVKQVYSTEEKVVGTWIDGKPLYQKVIVIGVVSTTEVSTPTGVSNIDQVIDIKGGGTMNAGQFLKWGFENAGGFCSCYYDKGRNSTVSIVSVTAYNLKSAYAILEYTKTTD